MDSLIAAAARALAAGDPLTAMKRVALRDDPPAFALRGIAMAQIGDLARARELLHRAARAFGAKEPVFAARCELAEAEIALVSRDLGSAARNLQAAREVLEMCGDLANAAHASYLDARRLLLIGELDEAERMLDRLDFGALPIAARSGYWLTVTGIAMRRIRAREARRALGKAREAAQTAGIPALIAETDRAVSALDAPAARLIATGQERLLHLFEVEDLIASENLIVDACRSVLRHRDGIIPLAGRPVLFALARTLAEAWPTDTPREILLTRVFRAREADETHRARLRVEIGRLRKLLAPMGGITATDAGFRLQPWSAPQIVVLAPPVDGKHAELLALLGDGEAWSSSALALALTVSPRTIQRALEALSETGKVEWFGYGRARRWIASHVPGFPTSLLLPAPLQKG